MERIPMMAFGSHQPTFYHLSLSWSQADEFLEMTVRDQGRYLVFLAVRDFIRLSPDYEPFDLLEPLPDIIRGDLRMGHALLVLDLSNEGPHFMKPIFDGFHRGMAENNLPLSSAVLLTQNRLLARAYESTYGRTGLSFGIHDYFVKLLIASLDTSLAKNFETAAEVCEHRPIVDVGAKDFLCMNATPRWSRILVYRYLMMRGYADRGLLSFHGANAFNPKLASVDQMWLPPAVPRDFGEMIAAIDNWMPQVPVRFDRETRMGNDLALSLETWAYRASLYSIVTESDFFESDHLERVTEKVIKAAGLGHPFIVVGNPRSVRFLAELGFDTFSGLINHDYDLVVDPTERMRLVFREIDRQQAAVAADRQGWIAETRAAADHNFSHARHGLRYRYARLVEAPLLERFRRFIAIGSLDHPV